MNLLKIPHFGRGKDVNSCVKKLLAKVHGGLFWMERLVPIYVYLIENITRLPTDGVSPEQYLDEKMKERTIAEEVKSQFDTEGKQRHDYQKYK
jgi:hypothetical protein